MLEVEELCGDIDDTWGSDFDDDLSLEENNGKSNVDDGDLYEIPDGKPSIELVNNLEKPSLKTGVVPDWLKKVEATLQHQHSVFKAQNNSLVLGDSKKGDENSKPPPTTPPVMYIEHVLLPTKATKEEESTNFIEALKRKLVQKNSQQNSKNYEKSVTNNSRVLSNGNNLQSGTTAESQNKNNNNDKTLQVHTQNGKSRDVTKRLNSIEIDTLKKIKESVQKFPWYYRVDRSKAELILDNYNSDGSFLVRECHHGGPDIPFTLTIRFKLRLFHIQIRFRPDGEFALGSAKVNEMHFSSIQEMIDTYRKTPLQLHTNGSYFGETRLTSPPIVYSVSK